MVEGRWQRWLRYLPSDEGPLELVVELAGGERASAPFSRQGLPHPPPGSRVYAGGYVFHTPYAVPEQRARGAIRSYALKLAERQPAELHANPPEDHARGALRELPWIRVLAGLGLEVWAPSISGGPVPLPARPLLVTPGAFDEQGGAPVALVGDWADDLSRFGGSIRVEDSNER